MTRLDRLRKAHDHAVFVRVFQRAEQLEFRAMDLRVVGGGTASDGVKGAGGERKGVSVEGEIISTRRMMEVEDYPPDMFPTLVIPRENAHPVRLVIPIDRLVKDGHRNGPKQAAARVYARERRQCAIARNEFADDGDEFEG